MPPPSNYAGSLPIPALGQQPLSQGGTPTGPYTALLGSQMQPLLPPGVLPGQYPPPNFAGMPGVNAHLGQQLPQQQPAAVPPKKRQRESCCGNCFCTHVQGENRSVIPEPCSRTMGAAAPT